jgi:putative ABC transport system ATP-binding protein
LDHPIAVRELTKIYGAGPTAFRALDAVSLEVERGEVLLLMGPSGSGKTTLISILGCILQPTSGSVKILGEEVTRLGEKQLPRVRLDNIGFIFQGFNLFPTLTAGENVELALDLKGQRGPAAKRRARGFLEQVGLGPKYDSFPADLSGGEKQRVAIARAVATEPQVILADEPTAALDSHSGRTVMEMLRELAHRHGRAVVVVTHDNRVLEYGDRVVRIEDGRILSDSTEPEPLDESSVISNRSSVVSFQ